MQLFSRTRFTTFRSLVVWALCFMSIECPSCKNKARIKEAIFCSYESPFTCEVCNARLWSNRILSKGIAVIIWYTGIGFIGVILAFLNNIAIGLITLASIILLHLGIAYFEVWTVGLKVYEETKKT